MLQDHICTKKEKAHPYRLLFVLLYPCWTVDMVTAVQQIESQSKENNMLRMAGQTNGPPALTACGAALLVLHCRVWAPWKVRKIYPRWLPVLDAAKVMLTRAVSSTSILTLQTELATGVFMLFAEI